MERIHAFCRLATQRPAAPASNSCTSTHPSWPPQGEAISLANAVHELPAFLVSRHSFADNVTFLLGHCELAEIKPLGLFPALGRRSLVQASRLFAAGLALATGLGFGQSVLGFPSSSLETGEVKAILIARHRNTSPLLCQTFRSTGGRRLLEQDPLFWGGRGAGAGYGHGSLFGALVSGKRPSSSILQAAQDLLQPGLHEVTSLAVFLQQPALHIGQLGQDCVDAGLLQARESFTPHFPGRPAADLSLTMKAAADSFPAGILSPSASPALWPRAPQRMHLDLALSDVNLSLRCSRVK